MSQHKPINRRRFLKKAAHIATATAAFPYFVPASVLGKSGTVAPANRITIGCIGTGGRGRLNMRTFMAEPDVQVLAVCDVDAPHREKARIAAGLPPKSACPDFRDLLARTDIDAVVISTPDHWHVPIAVAAVKAGKDVFCEKPLSLTIAEGRSLCDAVKCYGAVFQTGSQQRSDSRFQYACELVRTGRLGKINIINVGLPGSRSIGPQPIMPVPDGFDYNMWLGPAPWKPYTKARCHGAFRHIFDYSGGKFIDWGAHHLDIVQFALRADDSGPVRIAGRGQFPNEGIYNTALEYDIDFAYADGTKVNASTEHPGGIRFEGADGWVFVNRGVIEAHPESLIEATAINRCIMPPHHRNFLDCVRLRKDPIAPAEVGHRSASVCHLGNIAMLLARTLNWDPQTERLANDPEAARMTARAMRAPWRL
ncbi:MAG TPA: Gfo/Idh/MocA family oxidoreductase [Sedimentisphaerales bacterium]|nr:Gfo/Idh/MocA family oxidoreductase [Sedimentisphaerales bacterium]